MSPQRTVAQYAEQIKRPVEHLLNALKAAGFEKQAGDPIAPKEIVAASKELRKAQVSSSEGQSTTTTTTTQGVGLRGGPGKVDVEMRRQAAPVGRSQVAPEAPSSQPDDEIHKKLMRNRAEQAERERREAAEQADARNRETARQIDERRHQGEATAPPEPQDAPPSEAQRSHGRRRPAPNATAKKPGGDRDKDRGPRSSHVRRSRPGQQGEQGRERNRKRSLEPVETVFVPLEVGIPQTLVVSQLASRLRMRTTTVIEKMREMGFIATANQVIDQDTAMLVAEEIGHKPTAMVERGPEERLQAQIQYKSDPVSRAPVVTVMGHVDHGKTSLLDHIRKTKVADGEAGGITQHIGAYSVKTAKGKPVTFLDTPGHEAFSQMRARGANATDIVILVVAANDGVMEQTKEAVTHTKDAGVPVVVAINKIDVEGANPERVKTELAGLEVIPEDWGGKTQMISVSAKTGEGIDALLEAVLLEAEVLELAAEDEGPAQGVVLEAHMDRQRGTITDVLVDRGCLKVGDSLLVGTVVGRVRALISDTGENLKSATPSTPVEIIGLPSVPQAGDTLLSVKDVRLATEIAEFRVQELQNRAQAGKKVSLEDLFARAVEGSGPEELRVVVKADVRGSMEAIVQGLQNLGNDDVSVRIVGSGVGGVSESDINLAKTAGAIVLAFNVRADNVAKKAIQMHGIDMRQYSVIYELFEDVENAMTGLLAPEVREEIVGVADVREVFRSSRFGSVAGCLVEEGKVERRHPVRVLRDNVVVHEGELDSLRRFRDDVAVVENGTECGIGVRNYTDIRPGDRIEVFVRREVARRLRPENA